ncbi:hypothetical protein [Polaromonas sp.]|uniref:hypothetical protein n=1 Tax=Polaromonas sp. TaxID=1869339 RepID=UPI00326576D7
MNHKVITLIKWLFLAIGAGMLVGAASLHSSAALPLSLLGLVFASTGGGIIGYGWWSTKKEALLRQHGHLIHADFQQVELNKALEVNGANPFRIVAQWHDAKNNQLFVFKSANLWFDPSNFVQGRKIPVYVDLSKPSRYHVDTSFLPKVHG